MTRTHGERETRIQHTEGKTGSDDILITDKAAQLVSNIQKNDDS